MRVLVMILSLLWTSLLAACASQPVVDAEPFEGRVAVNGTSLHVKVIGRGEPLVVIHGGPLLEHGYLVKHLAGLAKTRQLIFFDQRVCGRSAADVPSESIRIITLVEDIESLRVALGLERIDLLGHSWGGLLAMHYAIRYGQNLRSLILSNSVAASAKLWQQEQAADAARVTEAHKKRAASIRASEGFQQRRPAALAAMLVHSFRPGFHDPKLADQLELFVPDDYMDRSRKFGAIAPDLKDFDLHASLSRVTTKALVLYGASETGAEIGGRELQAALPGARFLKIPKAGHFPFVEQPEAFLAAVESFLAER